MVPLIAASAMFMENLDSTVIVTALPAMAREFGVSATSVSLGISVYLLAVAVFIPLSAWIADRFGTRTVLCTAISAFTLASFLCGFSTGLWTFVGMRFLQGAAAALMTPVARLVVVRNTPKADLMHAIAVITWPALIAPVLGPPIGGFITTYASWHWIFFMNLPIGALGIFMVLRFIPNQKSQDLRAFDVKGFVLTAGALASLILGLELLGVGGGRWASGGALLVVGFMAGLLAVRHATRQPHPIFRLDAVRVPSFFVAVIAGGLFSRVAISATPFLLPLLFQVGFGYSPFVSGLMVLAYFAGNIGMKLFTTRLVRQLGFRQILIYNGLALGATVLACATLQATSPVYAVMGLLFAGGVSRSLQMTALNSLAFADVPAPQMSAANTLSGLVQQIATTLGVAVGAFLLNLSQMLRGGTGFVPQDFQVAFLGIGVIGLFAVFACVGLKPDAGAAVSGHQVPG